MPFERIDTMVERFNDKMRMETDVYSKVKRRARDALLLDGDDRMCAMD